MTQLASKVIGPTDTIRYILDYRDWLDCYETIATATFTVIDAANLATVHDFSYAPDGRSVVFFVSANNTTSTTFTVDVKITTLVGGNPPGQTKTDSVVWNVIPV